MWYSTLKHDTILCRIMYVYSPMCAICVHVHMHVYVSCNCLGGVLGGLELYEYILHHHIVMSERCKLSILSILFVQMHRTS